MAAQALRCRSPIAARCRSPIAADSMCWRMLRPAAASQSSPHTVLVGDTPGRAAARMAARDSSGMPRGPVAMPTGEEKTAGHGTRHAAELEIQRSMVARLSAETYLFLVVAGVAGGLGNEGGAPGSLRAGSLGFRWASRSRARSSALPHSRHVFLHGGCPVQVRQRTGAHTQRALGTNQARAERARAPCGCAQRARARRARQAVPMRAARSTHARTSPRRESRGSPRT